MKTYLIIYDTFDTKIFRVKAETEIDAHMKALYHVDKEGTLDYIYRRIEGFWHNYFYIKDPNIYPIEECFHSYETAQIVFLLSVTKGSVFEAHKKIIFDFLSGNKTEEWWIDHDPFPLELKKFIIGRPEYHGNIAFIEKDIEEIQ